MTVVAILLTATALGYLLTPAAMLGIVGMDGDSESEFLIRALGVALLALVPATWATRDRDEASRLQRSVMIGVAGYLLLSSVVDLIAFSSGLVGVIAVPSIGFRLVIALAVAWLAAGGA